jgi:tripartite-type tricarboxylate transporter receptor subunit TctC
MAPPAPVTFSMVTGWPRRSASSGATQRPINLVVPYSAGGNVDVMARWVAPELALRLGQPVTIENVTGAGGAIGTEKVARAKPDGYTLLLSVESTILIARMVTPATIRYDGLKDLTPVTLLGSQPLTLIGKTSLPAKNAGELFELLRAHPDKYSYGTSGTGTSLHLGGEMLQQLGGVQMVHVPYRMGPQILTDMVGQQIDLAVLPLSMVLPQVNAGQIRAYGVMGKKSPLLPNTPSLAAVPAWKDAEVLVWNAIFAPAGTDAAIVTRLQKELDAVLALPDIQKKFAESGVAKDGLSGKAFADFLLKENAKFAHIVKQGNIKAE